MEKTFALTNAEEKLAGLIWDNEPVASMQLVKTAGDIFGWKKSTTFSVLKTLIKKDAAQNIHSTVTMCYTRAQYISGQSRVYVENAFGGSLPKFVTSFIGGQKLTREQARELIRLIDENTEDS